MFRLLYSDGSTSETADSIAAVQALYTGTLVARIQQRRSADISGWMTVPSVNARFIGDRYFDVTNKDWYVSVQIGTGGTDWVLLT